MKKYILFFLAVIVFTISCQQAEIIEETVSTTEIDLEARSLCANPSDALCIGCPTGICGTSLRYGKLMRPNFYIQNNLWNPNWPGASNSQQVWYNNSNGRWGVNTNHQHLGGIKMPKSYPGIVVGTHYGLSPNNTRGLPKKVRDLGNMWCKWEQSNNFTVGNASMDIWFHPTPNHGTSEADIELMIWTQRKGGQQPISYNYSNRGQPNELAIPYATKWFNGKQYKIYKGENDNGTKVYSFIQTNNNGKFQGKIKPFIDYCKNQGWISDNHYLLSVQAGWEIVGGTTAKTTKFQLLSI